MPLVISDETLRALGTDERQAKIDIACRWFDEGKLAIGYAARMAGLTEVEFERELESRGLPRYRITDEMFEEDVRTLKKLGRL